MEFVGSYGTDEVGVRRSVAMADTLLVHLGLLLPISALKGGVHHTCTRRFFRLFGPAPGGSLDFLALVHDIGAVLVLALRSDASGRKRMRRSPRNGTY